ncbi:hypothetical protein KM043_002821 [Ampulex compressa]|nr:hypothetical protein KM043_002821 [Ampulex compressa]
MKVKEKVSATYTPDLTETPNLIDDKPAERESYASKEIETKEIEETSTSEPVIITDNFFFPPSDNEGDEEYEDESLETTTESESVEESTTPKEEPGTTIKASTRDEEVLSRNTTDANVKDEDEEVATTVPTDTFIPEREDESSIAAHTSGEDAESKDATTPREEDSAIVDREETTIETAEITTTPYEETPTTIPSVVEDQPSDALESEEESTTPVDVPETTVPMEEVTTMNDLQDEAKINADNNVTTTTAEPEPSTSTTTETSKPKITPGEEQSSSKEAQHSDITIQEEKSTSKEEEKSRVLVHLDATSSSEAQRLNATLHSEQPSSEKTEKSDSPTQVEKSSSQEKDARTSKAMASTVIGEEEALTVQPIENLEGIASPPSASQTVHPVEPTASFETVLPLETTESSEDSRYLDDSYVPSVIPLDAEYATSSSHESLATKLTTSITSPTPEDIEAGLADDLYLSLSRPDFPQILPSKPTTIDLETESTPDLELEPSTSVYYTETVVTSTRLRTYTYVVTQLNGLETKVTSSTTVRPRVTTLTLTVPVTVTVAPTVESSAVSSVYNPESVVGENESKDEEEGRRFNLATRVMSNGVEVIVAGPTPALRWENSNPQPTLTLSDTVVMLLPQEKPNEFVTKTCTTTFTYLSTITKDGTTTVSTEQQVVANTATEERHRKPGSETAAVTLEASPTLRTEVFKTTYTYLTLNTDHPNVDDALESSTKVITNTVTAPQHYLDMILEPSEAPRPETNTYLSTRVLEKTFMEDGRTRVETTSDTITQLIVTESAPPPRPTSVTTTLTALDNTEGSATDSMKTYYITYTYYNTFLEKGSTVIRTNVATSTDVVLEKLPVKKTTTKSTLINPTPEPIQIFATKTYLTTFTYFTTLLQAGPDGETSTTVSSRSHIVENVVTESIAPSLLDAGYMNALLTTAHHSDPVKNVVTGSTIIFFDEEDQIDPTTTTSFAEITPTAEVQKDEKPSASPVSTTSAETLSDAGISNGKPVEQVSQENNATSSNGGVQNKRPAGQTGGDLQVSNLLSLGSLGINSLSALGPVITAMAGLLQGKTSATRRNDTAPVAEAQEVTTQRSPIYIPVAEFADGDIEAAESQNIAAHLVNLNHNYIAETRHKVATSLADGIPISPGEVITANSDVIIGKPGKMAPRPPHTFLNDEQHIGMKPPPMPVPNIPVHPVLEILEGDHDDSQPQQTAQGHKGPQVQILPAQQVYEEHLKIPVSLALDTDLPPKQPQKLHPIQASPPKRIVSKQDILENDPLLKPPDRINVEQYPTSNAHLKTPEWSHEKFRRPWSAKDPLTPPLPPVRFDEKVRPSKPLVDKSWPVASIDEQKRPPWAQKDPLLPDASVVIQSSESNLAPSKPIIHQVPHVIDRSTGQPLLVNIQPSQVANVVIPQGGTQALIFGDTSEPHISGQYFDDPSPYPEPEVGPGFVGIQRVEDLPQYSNEKDPADYMVPPSPPSNFKPLSQKPSTSNRPHAIPLSPVRFDYSRPQDKVEAAFGRPDKRLSEVHLIKRPDGASSGQGHVHTEILVHHRPETVRPQPVPVLPQSSQQLPPRGQFSKVQKPNDSTTPPRRTEVSAEAPHRYIFLGKPDSGNEIGLTSTWKSDKKPPRITLGRPRPRPPTRGTTNRPADRPIYVERPGGHSGRKPVFAGPQRHPPKTQNTFLFPHRPPVHPHSHHEPPSRKPSSSPGDVSKEVLAERPSLFGHHAQVDLQDRPPHFYSEKAPINNPVIVDTQTERNEEHVPTGAIEYHNPSNPKVKIDNTKYYSQAGRPQVQNFGHILVRDEENAETWHANSQTEKTLDSEPDASEQVKYGDSFEEETQPSDDRKDLVVSTDSQSSNASVDGKNPFVDVVSINTVVGKPLEVEQGITYGQKERKPSWQNEGVPFGHNSNNVPPQGMSHGLDFHNARPYETPVVQRKPFGVYTGYADLGTPYGYKRKESRPDYDIVQGVPSTYHPDKPPSQYHKIQEGTSTQKPYDRDDTIDLKPPAITPQFAPESGRPYQRPHPNTRPETRPVHYPRPEIITKSPGKFEIRPDRVVNRPGDTRPIILESFGNQSLDRGVESGHSRPDFMREHEQLDWSLGVRVPDHRVPQHDKPQAHEPHKNTMKQANFKNNTDFYTEHQAGSYGQSNMGISNSGSDANHPAVHQSGTSTIIHPDYPHIITKPKPQVPGPITISSGGSKIDSQDTSNMKFSMSVEAMGEEVDSKTQTERPPSMLITRNNSTIGDKNDETLETAFQTNFASSGGKDKVERPKPRPIEVSSQDMLADMEKMSVPSRDMMPPPLRLPVLPNQSTKSEQDDLKPPPLHPQDVVGLSPPPLDITTTSRPLDDRFGLDMTNESGLKPPPKYIPTKESSIAPPLPSISMVPPNPRPSLTRPFLVELLSQDMVPPPPVMKTTGPLEIATVRPAVAVSGSIQIATAVATSHIPVVQDMESKIPIIHGTVDLPVVVDVPEILRPLETKMTEHVSIYTVRPFDTRPVSRISVQATTIPSTNLVMPTKLRSPQVDHIQPSRASTTHRDVEPTKSHGFEIPRNPVKRPEHPIFLESSHENLLPSTRVEPTESLTRVPSTAHGKKEESTKMVLPQTTSYDRKNQTIGTKQPSIVTRVDSSVTKVTSTLLREDSNFRRNETTTKSSKNILGTTQREMPKNASSGVTGAKSKEVTRFRTSTVTRVETSVLGSPPTTRTLLLTHTMTSTTVETVTETLLRPTSVVSTVTSTILQPVVTRVASHESVEDNDSIFVVMSDRKPPAPGGEEVEAEYGEEDISRDEQDPAGNEIHRVLASGVLGAPVVSIQPITNQCTPECKASKAEVCAEIGNEMRCICRPGFARMFPDRPCKPTYTYTLRIGLNRIGHEIVNYDADFKDSNTTAYRRLAGPTKDALDRTLMQSDLRDVYRGLKISGFTPDPMKVEFHVQLSDNASETRLKEVLRKYLVGSNYSLGGTEVYASKNLDLVEALDFDECSTEEDGPHHDCSPHAACFNLRGSYQCSCKEGWADLSENPAYPGRVCSQAPLGCPSCNNKGHCVTNTHGQEVCECFPWHSGQRCQVNLKALVTTGAILLGLLAVCVGMACLRHPNRRRGTGDRRAMIPGTGGDTSSEGSITDLAIPHHVPHVLPPPPQMIAPLPPTKRPVRKISGKPRHPPRKATMVPAAVPINDEQRDRSLTVMIPRAKYRSAPQSPQNYKSNMSTFAAEEHKLINYLDSGTHNGGNRKQSISSMKDCKEAELQVVRAPVAPTGALVSAGFQVSATVTRPADAESTLARSCGETTVESATKVLRAADLQGDLGSTLARSCGETTIQAPTKLLRLDLGEAGSTLARSCGETTIQPPTKVAATRRNSVKDARDNRDARDSASEGHTMAERDLGSTLRLPAQHPPLYSPDRTSDRESNFDSL